jgi:phage terminase small subunit
MPKKSKKISKNKNLSAKRERFCQEYIIDNNGTQAAIRAKYSKKGAGQRAGELLKKIEIRSRIAELEKELVNKIGVTKEMVVREYKKLAFSNAEDVFNWETEVITIENSEGQEIKRKVARPFLKKLEEMSPAARASISEIRETQHGITIKLHDKKGSLDSLSRYLGMFSDKIEHSGPNGGPIETNFSVEFVKCKEKK